MAGVNQRPFRFVSFYDFSAFRSQLSNQKLLKNKSFSEQKKPIFDNFDLRQKVIK